MSLFILVNVVNVAFCLLNIKGELITRFSGAEENEFSFLYAFLCLYPNDWIMSDTDFSYKIKTWKHFYYWLCQGLFFSINFFPNVQSRETFAQSFISQFLHFHWISLFSHPFTYLFFSLVWNIEFNLSGTESSKAYSSVQCFVCFLLFFTFLFLQDTQDRVLFFLTFYSYFLFQMKRKPPRLAPCLQVRTVPTLYPTL